MQRNARRAHFRLKPLARALAACSFLTVPPALAQITPANGATQNFAHPSGVPVVQIARPNGAGLSHNVFTHFNVPTQGAVLNNSAVVVMSKLAGSVPANPNLTAGAEARTILNEVIAPNRSVLQGYLEVAGRAADVIVANPYGITCSGCGFINTPRVTLTTGVPTIGSGGTLDGFRINAGDVLITGTGADASEQSYFDILARSISVQGQVNARDLVLVAGTNGWDYAGRSATPIAPGADAPAYAIDSSALGGMYAERIRLIATEEGAGVRMLGDVAASAADLVLTSAGKIELRNKASAAGDVAITYTGATPAADAIAFGGAGNTLYAGRDLSISGGGTTLAGGTLAAARDVVFNVDALADSGAATDQRFSGGTLTVASLGPVSLSGTTWGAPGALSFSAASGDLALGTAKLVSDAAITLSAADGAVSTAAGGTVNSAGDLRVSATGFSNAGEMVTDGDFTLRKSQAAGILAATSGGRIEASGRVDLAGYDAGGGADDALDFANSGIVLGNTLAVKARDLTNTNGMQGTAGATLEASGTVTNSGTLVLSHSGSNDGTLSAGTLVNNAGGFIQSARDLTVTARVSVSNAGTVIAARDLAFNSSNTAADLALANSGVLQAGGTLSSAGAGAFSVDIGNVAGAKMLGATIALAADDVQNRGILQSDGTLEITAKSYQNLGGASLLFSGGPATITADRFRNEGAAHSQDALTVTSVLIQNTASGGLSSLGNMALIATRPEAGTGYQTNIENAGAITSFGTLDLIAHRNVTNASTGEIRASGDLQIGRLTDNESSVYGVTRTVTNQGLIEGAGDITITADAFENAIQDPGKTVVQVDTTKNYEGDSGRYVAYDQQRVDLGLAGDGDHAWREAGGGYHVIDDAFHLYIDYSGTYVLEERFVTTPSSVRPQVIGTGAGKWLTIRGFSSANNTGGLLSAANVRITGKPGATFTNTDLALYRETWNYWGREKWRCRDDDIACLAYPWDRYLLNEWDLYDDALARREIVGGIDAGIRTSGQFVADPGLNITLRSTQPVGGTGGGPGAPVAATRATLPGGLVATGLVLTLPSNPNGFFVVSQDPKSSYLVQTNPLFGLDAAYLGSDYLAEKLNVPTDQLQRRLGDAAYENFLVRQQIIAQTGLNLIGEARTEAEQMQALLDNAAWAAGELNLKLGVALTAEQVNALKQDIVWMVEQEVAGQKVLVPVVYLSNATRANLTRGSQIVATDIAIADAETFTNLGGTVRATGSLAIEAKGDITNVSGTISGGTVALRSVEGSIVNRTATQTTGGDQNRSTVVGDTGTIQATGDLSLQAGRDIRNQGADVRAGGDARLEAGRDVVFEALQIRSAQTTSSTSGDGVLTRNESITTTTTTDLQGSTLGVGGNLEVQAGRNVRFTASSADVQGDATLKAGRDVVIESGRRTEDVASRDLQSSNLGMTRTEVTTDTRTTTQVGSTFNVGGSLGVESGRDITIASSTVNVGGDAELKASRDLNIVSRQNTATSETNTSRSGFFAEGGKDEDTVAQYSGVAGIEVSTQKDTLNASLSQGSSLNVGGNAKLSAGKTVTVQGSDVAAGGNLDVSGTDIRVLAAENKVEATRELDATRVGVRGTAGLESAGGSFEVGNTQSTERESQTVARVSTLTAGGDMTRTATNKITDQGTQISAGGDFTQSAHTIESLAAENRQEKSSESTTWGITAGGSVQIGGESLIEQGKEAFNTLTQERSIPSLEMPEIPSAGIDAGFKMSETTSSSTTTQAVTSTIRAGGNVTSTSTGETRLQGTTIEGENVALTGGSVTFEAAQNTASTSESSMELEVQARVQVDPFGTVSGSVGVDHSESRSDSTATQAVVGTIRSRGSTTISATSGDARLVGTNIDAGGDATVQAAGNVSIEAARDTETYSSTSNSTSASLSAQQGGAGIGFSRSDASEEYSASLARAGSIRAGGNLTIQGGNNVTLEGTNLEAGGTATIEATRGNVDYRAAESTVTYSSSSSDVSVELSAAKSSAGKAGNKTRGVGGSFSLGVETASDEQTVRDQQGGSVVAQNLVIRSGGDTRLQGTQANVTGTAEISAGGSLTIESAQRTETREMSSTGVDIGLTAQRYTGKGAVAAKPAATAKPGAGQRLKGALIGSSGGNVSIGVSTESESVDRVANTNASITAGTVRIETGGDTRLSGANVEGARVETNIGGNLLVESRVDREVTSSSQTSVEIAGGRAVRTPRKMGIDEKAQNAFTNLNTVTQSGLSVETKSRSVDATGVGQVSGIVATESGDIRVQGQTTVRGANLGGVNTTLQTGSLRTESIETRDERRSSGGGADLKLQAKNAPIRADRTESTRSSGSVQGMVFADTTTASGAGPQTSMSKGQTIANRARPIAERGEALDPRGAVEGTIADATKPLEPSERVAPPQIDNRITANVPAAAVTKAVGRPEVQKALAVKKELGKAAKAFGGEEKIPPETKAAMLKKLGVDLPEGQSPDAAMKRLLGEAQQAVLASAKQEGGMSDAQAKELARMVGLLRN